VSELDNGMRVLRVNGEVFSSYDTHNGGAVHKHKSNPVAP
jgi:hypothetical protein